MVYHKPYYETHYKSAAYLAVLCQRDMSTLIDINLIGDLDL